MFKVDPFATDVHHATASVVAEPGTEFLTALAVAVTFMLITFAVEWIWKTLRRPAPAALILGGLAVAAGLSVVASLIG